MDMFGIWAFEKSLAKKECKNYNIFLFQPLSKEPLILKEKKGTRGNIIRKVFYNCRRFSILRY